MSNYAFIFARGGSKGLPGKNIKILSGKPLIQYSIDVAHACSLIDKIFVSTDDQDIARISQECGAEVIERPTELASDTASEWLAWRHAIKYVNQKHGHFDKFISLPATSPLRSVIDIEKAIAQLEKTNADICIGITPASRSPYFNMVKLNSDNFLSLVNKLDEAPIRRQDVPVVYDVTTTVYATYPEFVANNFSLFSGKVTSIEIPKERAIDIDDIYDFMFAERLMNAFPTPK